MTKEELLEKLRELARDSEENGPSEDGHIQADDLLVEYIDDSEIAEVYHQIGKWYA